MSIRSPSGTSVPSTGSRTFATGVLSPVSPASSISSVAATRMRPSAGTLSPASKPTMSPGTSSSAGICTRSPSRRTLAVMMSIWRSAATLSAALPSWCNPMTAFRTVSPMTTNAVETSCKATMLTSAAPTSTSCMRSRYCRRNAFQAGSFASSASLFGPYRSRRAVTSAAVRPIAGSTSSRRQTSSADRRYQSVRPSAGVAGVVVATITGLLRARSRSSRAPCASSSAAPRRDRSRAR